MVWLLLELLQKPRPAEAGEQQPPEANTHTRSPERSQKPGPGRGQRPERGVPAERAGPGPGPERSPPRSAAGEKRGGALRRAGRPGRPGTEGSGGRRGAGVGGTWSRETRDLREPRASQAVGAGPGVRRADWGTDTRAPRPRRCRDTRPQPSALSPQPSPPPARPPSLPPSLPKASPSLRSLTRARHASRDPRNRGRQELRGAGGRPLPPPPPLPRPSVPESICAAAAVTRIARGGFSQ
nr:uncharacterized protein LOC116276825 [Vicugna pacos]